jgi:hypothetical protein
MSFFLKIVNNLQNILILFVMHASVIIPIVNIFSSLWLLWLILFGNNNGDDSSPGFIIILQTIASSTSVGFNKKDKKHFGEFGFVVNRGDDI